MLSMKEKINVAQTSLRVSLEPEVLTWHESVGGKVNYYLFHPDQRSL